jgi:hypothetical protein
MEPTEILSQVFILIILPILTYFVRTYVKSASEEKRLGSIVRLSNIAIDYAEDLHKRGDLEKYMEMWGLPDAIINHTSHGIQKLNLAGKWLEGELNKLGIKMTDEQAQSWIAAEFRKRVGDTGREKSIAQQTREAVRLLQALEQSGLIELPTTVDQAVQLADYVADWIMDQLDTGDPLREQALAEVQNSLMAQPRPRPIEPELPLETRLAELARQSVRYVEQLERTNQLTLPQDYIAAAWVLTEVTKQDLRVSPDQITAAVRAAFGARNAS